MLYFVEQVTPAYLVPNKILCTPEKTTDYPWHIGQSKPTLEGKCVEVQADGHELDHIKASFTNLPISNETRVVKWSGDLAQFIYDNLPRGEMKL